MAFRSNGGHIAGEDISAYVDEELSSRDAARVAAHLQTCDECSGLADDMRATQALVRDLPLVRAPRDFTLGPEFDVVPARAPVYDAPPRRWFNFMPAIAMSAALLLILVFADLSSLSTSSDDSAGGASSGPRAVEDALKAAAESQPSQALPPVPRAAQPAPPPGGSGGAPSTQGFLPTPAAANSVAGPSATPMPLAIPAVAPAAPQTPGAPAVAPLIATPPTTGLTTAREPTPTSYAVVVGADEAEGADGDDQGIGVVRILQIVAAVVLVGSLGGLYWQKRRGALP